METIINLQLEDQPLLRNSKVFLHSEEKRLSNSQTIKDGGFRNKRIATFEPNYWALDGLFRFQGEGMKCGYVTEELTDAEGNYASGTQNKAINIVFPSDRKLTKVTVMGSRTTGDFISKFRVQYLGYNSDNGYFTKEDFIVYAEEVSHTFTYPADGIRAIRIIPLATNRPNRRARIMSIAFDDAIILSGNSITAANVLCEVSLSGAELPYGIFSARFVSPDPQAFDITDMASVYNRLKYRLPIEVYYFDGEDTRHIGRYFLTEWKSESANVLTIEGFDVIGLMEEIPYQGDFWQSDANFLTIARRVLSFVPDVKKVSIADGFTPPQLHGLLKKGTIREAFRQVLFAGGAMARIVNGDEIVIDALPSTKSGQATNEDFGSDKKALNGQELIVKPQVTRIELTTHNFRTSETLETIFEGDLDVGEQIVEFREPGFTPSDGSLVSGATLLSTTPLIARLRVDNPGKVTISGRRFADGKRLIEISSGATGKEYILKVDEAMMVTSEAASRVIYQLQAFATKRFRQRFRAFTPKTLEAGEIVSVAVFNGRTLIGAVERLAINLAGGCVTEYTVTGSIRDAGANFTRAITVLGTVGTVTPGEFYYPSTSSQEFIAQVTAANADDYGIAVTINGVLTIYPQISAAFTLPMTDEGTQVMVSFPVVSRMIVVGTEGTVTPGRFRLSSKIAQYFMAKVKPAYTETRGIAVTIDGNTTVHGETERRFQLPTTGENTQVTVTFPDVTKAIEIAPHYGQLELSVTPNRFRHSMGAVQNFTARKSIKPGTGWTSEFFYIAVIVNGVKQLYDTDTKVFQIQQTTPATTVKVTTEGKPHKNYTITGWNDPWGGTGAPLSLLFYPIKGVQTLSFTAPSYPTSEIFNGMPVWKWAKMDVRWYINGALKSTQLDVEMTSFEIRNTSETTDVRAEISNIRGESGGGNGSGGGSGYTPWTAKIRTTIPNAAEGVVLRDGPNNGAQIGSLYLHDEVLVIGQANGTPVSGNSLWYNVNVLSGVSSGLTGWVWSGAVFQGTNPNL